MSVAVREVPTILPGPRRFSRAEYHLMGDLGMFRGQRVELIDGKVVLMGPIGPPRVAGVILAGDVLREVFRSRYVVRVQSPIGIDAIPSEERVFGEGEPEPDLAVVPGTARDWIVAHPTTALLIVEVADSSLEYDRTTKASLYARIGVPDYWIVNLPERRLEVYRDAAALSGTPFGAAYRSVRLYLGDESVAPLEKPKATIQVADLLPWIP